MRLPGSWRFGAGVTAGECLPDDGGAEAFDVELPAKEHPELRDASRATRVDGEISDVKA